MAFVNGLEGAIVARVALAFVLGLMIGLQRERKKVQEQGYGIAGLRTHSLVAVGSALVAAINVLMFSSDPLRLAASILTGIGFLGAGTIIAFNGRIRGLVNAASIWVAAALGIACGLGVYFGAIVVAVIVIIILELERFEKID
jgi:putative Mg2+ transporter-C (MgtC) family protein